MIRGFLFILLFLPSIVLGQYLFNNTAGAFIDFELDISEQTNIITKILKYCGIIINDPTLIQVASQEAQQTSTNEKS